MKGIFFNKRCNNSPKHRGPRRRIKGFLYFSTIMPMRRNRYKRVYFISLALLLISLQACQQESYHFNEGSIFGTVYHVTYLSKTDVEPAFLAELNRFDAELSMFNENSTLSRFNRHDTSAFSLEKHPWVEEVVSKSLLINTLTDGAFDITVAPLVNAWGFGFAQSADVTPAYLDSLMTFVGSDKITLQGHTLSKSDPRVQLDASAIAKGYACDVVAACLEKHGITDYLVEIGGEMVLKGKNPKGSAWRIGINSPDDDSTSTHLDWDQRLVLTNRSLATSGNYRRYYIKDGKRYAHTIDPKTGNPVQHNLLSATVIAGNCLTADALATAFMVMGSEKALALAEKLPDVEAFFICAGLNDSLYTQSTSGASQWLP